MAITTHVGAVVLEETSAVIPADVYGNNLSIECPACQVHPVLLIARPGWPGSADGEPAECRACGAQIWMTTPVDPGLELEEIRIDFEVAE